MNPFNTPRPAYLLDLPLSDYTTILQLQRNCVAARRMGSLDRDFIIVVEHPSVFTLGRRGRRENLLIAEEILKNEGITVIPVERGGDVTYHGPGQIVVYPIVDLNLARLRVIEFVELLEEAMILTAADWGITARGDQKQRGAWVEQRKLGSVGITIRRGVSFHGLALNVNTDLTPFSWINPCGIPNCTMTSMAQETRRELTLQTVRSQITGHLGRLLRLDYFSINCDDVNLLVNRPAQTSKTEMM